MAPCTTGRPLLLQKGGLLLCLLGLAAGLHPAFPARARASTAQTHPVLLTLADTAQVETTLNAITQIADAEATQKTIREAMQALDKQIESARNAKEIEVMSCLVEQRAKLRALLRVVTTATVLLQEALDGANQEEAVIQYRRILVARKHFEQLIRDAAACAETAGVPVVPAGNAVTQVLESPLIEDDAIPDPIETLLDPDLGTLPCW